MDEIDRLKLCITLTDADTVKLQEAAGMDKSRFSKTLKKKIRLSSSELIALANCFPSYKHWIVFGEERPESGDVSPMTKLAQKDYRTQEGG